MYKKRNIALPFFITALTLSVLVLSNQAQAQEDNVLYREKTEVDFEALDIEGALKKPGSDFVMSRKDVMFNPLLPPRTDFNPEMLQSIEDVR